MREGWKRVPLGQLTTQVREQLSVKATDAYTSLGLKMYGKGVFAREPKRGDSIKATMLYSVRAGQFIYNRMFAAGGSFGTVPASMAHGVVSNEFPVFDVDEDKLLTPYLDLYFQQPEVWSEVERECTGTTKSRNRWKENDFARHEVPLPPLAEQQRIVDLIGSLDEAIEAADETTRAHERAMREISHGLLATHPIVEAGSLIERISAGKSPSTSNELPAHGQPGVLKVSAVHPMGFMPSEAKALSDASIFSTVMAVQSGDVLISRANTADRVGMVCLVDESYPLLFLSDKTLRLEPKAGVNSACLVETLQSDTARRQFSGSGTGTSGSMKNISHADIRGVSVRWPTSEVDQLRIAGVAAAGRECYGHAATLTASLRYLRTNLLTALLSGAHEIPESYDDQLSEAV